MGMDNHAPQPEWLTYREAAKRLGISRAAVKSRARRLGWPRRSGTTPMDATFVHVPPDGTSSPRDAILSELQDLLVRLEDAERP
jgi:hypothetical protein